MELKFSELSKFQPKQIEALKQVKAHTYTVYGGAAGGGKSYFLRWLAVYLLVTYAKKYGLTGVRVGLFCEDYPSLKERQLSKVVYEFPAWLGDLNKSDHEFRLSPDYGGGVIAFRNLDDPSKYLSSEFAAILVDELTRNPRETFDFLNMRRRWPGIKDTKFVGATNPGGIGHAFVKKLWVDRDFNNEQYDPEDFAFIPARATDNIHLGKEYEKQLDLLPEKLRKAYKDGNWDVFAGQYFTEWDKTRHVIPSFEIPTGWIKIRCLDYGLNAPSACYWLAIDYDGRVYVYRELYERGLTYEALAKKIVEMTPKEELIEYTVADTSMFAKTQDTGKFGDEIMSENGVEITQANKERLAGANLLRHYLKSSMIVFFPTCANAIRTIPSLVYDEGSVINIEDIAKGQDDHGYDAIRYGLMSIPPIPTGGPPAVYNPYEGDPDSPWGKDDLTLDNPYSYDRK